MAVLTGEETIAAIRAKQAKTLLAFSTGKDAIATWLAIRDKFDEVVPYYLYLIPGMEFIEESLDYYERFFGAKIIRLPHPSLYRLLNNLVFQPPERCLVIEQAELENFDYEDVRQCVISDRNLHADTFAADGVRAADSPMRRISIMTHGPISYKQHRYHPVWDWNKARIIDEFRRSGVKLPIDYRVFGRTFDGIDLRFILPLRKHFPRDYKRLLEWFPMAELEVFRYEHAAS